MRAILTIVVALVASWFVGYVAEIGLGIAFKAGEELIVAMVLEVAVAVGLATIFAVMLMAGGGARAVDITAVAVVVLGFLALAGLEAFALIDESNALMPSDLPLLAEIGIPALLTVLVQWWLVRRHVRRGARRAPLASATAG